MILGGSPVDLLKCALGPVQDNVRYMKGTGSIDETNASAGPTPVRQEAVQYLRSPIWGAPVD